MSKVVFYKENSHSRAKDMIGKKFNMLTVVDRLENQKQRAMYLCICDCGKTRNVLGQNLRSGRVKDCGCVSQKIRSQHISEHNKTHGHSKSKLYKCWSDMKSRCFNTHNKEYKNYGLRGIKVCDKWRDSFECFEQWAISNGYKENLTIDRTDVNKDYEPSNCRWITMTEQCYNKRNTRKIYLNKIGKTASEWSKIFPLTSPGIYGYAKTHNWQLKPYLEAKNIKLEEYFNV